MSKTGQIFMLAIVGGIVIGGLALFVSNPPGGEPITVSAGNGVTNGGGVPLASLPPGPPHIEELGERGPAGQSVTQIPIAFTSDTGAFLENCG